MNTFKHIEDYLEILANYREINGKSSSGSGFLLFGFNLPTPPSINLARYDISIVNSMASHTINNGSLTDRQAALAIKLVEKYRRQFANKGVDVDPIIKNPIFRNPIRVVDRTKSIKLEKNKIVIRFPYEKELVNEITAASRESKGKWLFDREAKIWVLALTEYSVNWAVAFGTKNQFAIDPEVSGLMNKILEVEQAPYKIELVSDNGELKINNAEPSLNYYIMDHLGGFEQSQLPKLVDYAPVLGYTVNDKILQSFNDQYSSTVSGILFNKESHIMRFDHQSDGLEILTELVEYCKLVDRWPLYIYEPDTSFKLRTSIRTLIADSDILDMSNKKSATEVDLTGIKCVYFSKSKRAWSHRIPILLSTNAMFHGSDRQNMLQLAEKVVFYTATTYNKDTKIKRIV